MEVTENTGGQGWAWALAPLHIHMCSLNLKFSVSKQGNNKTDLQG